MEATGTPRRTLTARAEDAGRPLSDFLAQHCPEAPAGFMKKLIRKGYVLLQGAPATLHSRLQPGQRVVLTLPDGAWLVAPNPAVPFTVRYEDADLAVVDKPAGVVSEPGIGHKLDSLLNGLIARYGVAMDQMGPELDFGMVHRLDRDTSGLMVVARTADAQRTLSRAFRTRAVEKRYTALVAGRLAEEEGTIRLALGRVRRHGRATPVVGAPGLPRAVTRFTVIERFRDATLVEARPETGRWRQIRLHFEAIGHPVAGDSDHGDPAANAALRQRYGLDRLFLHAAVLAFAHPAQGRTLRFTSPLPEELERSLRALRETRHT